MDASPRPRRDAGLPGPSDGTLETPLTRDAGVAVPLLCGAMYPCSNPELVAAVSAAGGLGVVQPVSLTYVHGHGFREGLRHIRSLTDAPVGMNALIEASSRAYRRRMEAWVDAALEEGLRFFVTSLGKPRWVVDRVHAVGGKVYHDVTERRWALKAADSGVDGLIAVNARAGGHPGPRSPEALLAEVGDLGLPVVCAGGVATPEEFARTLAMGYDGVQMGTRFIATHECRVSRAYKEAILAAGADDIIHTERISGVPVAVIDTPWVRRTGTRASPLARWLLRGRRTKRLVRSWYALRSMWALKRASLDEGGAREYWQAGKSVEGIGSVDAAGDVVEACRRAYESSPEDMGSSGSPSPTDDGS